MIHGNHSPVRQIEVDAIHIIGVKGRKSMNLGIQREDVGEESMERCVGHRQAKNGSTTYLKSEEKVHPRDCVTAKFARLRWSRNESV